MSDGAGGTVLIRLGGVLAVETAGGRLSGSALGSRKARTLLGLVAAARGRPVPVDRIVDAVWPDAPPDRPVAGVATLVSRLRRDVHPDLLTGGGGRTYRLPDGGPWRLDLDDAAASCAEAAARLAAGQPVLAVAASRAALDLLGPGPALADEADAGWVEEVRREARELVRTAGHLLAAALVDVDPAEAVRVAAAAVARDRFDEQAVRDLMRALLADGRAPAALAAHDDLAALLREELGTDPAAETTALHLAVLREAPTAADVDAGRGAVRPVLVGREDELSRLERAWAATAGGGADRLAVVEGEAGIGKTRLLDTLAAVATASGGRVLAARCHSTERSLFLQPYLDVVRPLLLAAPTADLADLVRDHEPAWRDLLPELAPVLPGPPAPPADVELQRRRAFDAVAALLRRLARARPVLLLVDDLQDGGAATVDLLGHLAGQLDGAPVLLVAAVRAEQAESVDRLRDRAVVLRLEPLPRSAVDALAAQAGLAEHGGVVMARTGGHPLSVVECLRALGAGDDGVPASLADAVARRVERLEPEARAVVEGAAVLRRRLDPRLVAAVVDSTELAVTRRCEELTRLRLLVRSGEHYEFANDLLQECVHAALPPALAVAYHRRAADVLTARPEAMAEHAHAAGDVERAAHGWLLAGEEALRRAAVEDAGNLLDRSLAAEASSTTRARALLVRGRVHEARSRFADALADVDAALTLARSGGDRRLEMAALRARGGDLVVGLRRDPDEIAATLEAGLELAADLGDREAEADFTGRLAVLDASRLRLATALERSQRSLARSRAAGSPGAVLLALDGLKTAWSYLGDPEPLRTVIAELEPAVRARDEPWLLQWVVFESSFVAAAEGRLDDARGLVAEALELNERSGFPAYAAYLHAHDGWFARLAGDLDDAVRVGREALTASSSAEHPWWTATAAGLLAASLADNGEHDEAVRVARRALVADDLAVAPAGRLRCVAALARLTGEPDAVAEATAMLDDVACPPGHAWVVGADCYLAVAAAAVARGDGPEAVRVLAPLRDATAHAWPAVAERVAALLPQSSSATSRAARAAPSAGTSR